MATPNNTLSELLGEIEERASKATSGPWSTDPTGDCGEWLVGTPDCPIADCDFGDLTGREITTNAAFIAASRTDVPALVKALRRAIKGLEYFAITNALSEITAILEGKGKHLEEKES